MGAETSCNILPLSSSKDEEHALLALQFPGNILFFL